MCYRCEALGQSNKVHQLQLLQKVTLMKNCDFCIEKMKLWLKILWTKCVRK